ncbi:DMT family transporter [Pelagibacteraceae bacterium]|nr:DMT family transporter [Pelagibacteraceae bacterium]
MTKLNNEILGTLCLLAAGFFLSFGGLLIKLVDGASTMQITSYRSITFSLVALIYILITFKKQTPQAFIKIGPSGLLLVLILTLSNIFFVFGMSNTSVANAVFIMSTGPLWAAVASYFYLKKIIGTKTIIAILGSMFGIMIMFSQGLDSSRGLGNMIILGVPICFAAQLTIINKKSNIDFMPSTFLAGILIIVIGLFFIEEHTISSRDLFIVLFMGAFQVGLGFLLITVGSRYIPPHRAALYVLLEPILAPIWAWIGIGEKPPIIELVGGLIVFSFVAWRLIDQFIGEEKI